MTEPTEDERKFWRNGMPYPPETDHVEALRLAKWQVAAHVRRSAQVSDSERNSAASYIAIQAEKVRLAGLIRRLADALEAASSSGHADGLLAEAGAALRADRALLTETP